eukprot:361619-Chlamydomonas_euryale.AAC.8
MKPPGTASRWSPAFPNASLASLRHQLLPHCLPHCQLPVKQSSSGRRGRNRHASGIPPQKYENARDVCGFWGLRTHSAPADTICPCGHDLPRGAGTMENSLFLQLVHIWGQNDWGRRQIRTLDGGGLERAVKSPVIRSFLTGIQTRTTAHWAAVGPQRIATIPIIEAFNPYVKWPLRRREYGAAPGSRLNRAQLSRLLCDLLPSARVGECMALKAMLDTNGSGHVDADDVLTVGVVLKSGSVVLVGTLAWEGCLPRAMGRVPPSTNMGRVPPSRPCPFAQPVCTVHVCTCFLMIATTFADEHCSGPYSGLTKASLRPHSRLTCGIRPPSCRRAPTASPTLRSGCELWYFTLACLPPHLVPVALCLVPCALCLVPCLWRSSPTASSTSGWASRLAQVAYGVVHTRLGVNSETADHLRHLSRRILLTPMAAIEAFDMVDADGWVWGLGVEAM